MPPVTDESNFPDYQHTEWNIISLSVEVELTFTSH